MNVLVFGGNGFLGMELEEEFKNNNYNFFSASRNTHSGYKLDISNFEEFANLPLDFFDVVINCASILPGESMLDNDYLNKVYSTNILGTQNICKWIASQKSIKRIINCSTLVVVNKPWDYYLTEEATTYPTGEHVIYCSSKLMQELIVDTFAKKYNIDFLNVRFSSIYGKEMPKNGIIWTLYQQCINNNFIKITNGNKVSFDFINVKDAARILVAAIEVENTNRILNAASGVETSLLELASIVKKNISESIEIENKDHDDFTFNLSKINVTKLNQMINSGSFLSLDEGIKQVFKVW
jgi:UDP-glucose 4-epimerase